MIMYLVLLPLCTFPLMGMIVSTLLDLPIPTWYLTGLFAYNIVKAVSGGLGLCFADIVRARTYFVVFYVLFLLADVVMIPVLLNHVLQDSLLFVICFVLMSFVAYVPMALFILQKKWHRQWRLYFRFQHTKGRPIGVWFIVLSTLWLTTMVLFLGYVFQFLGWCMYTRALALWFSGLMLAWMVLLLTCFLSIAACVPFRRRQPTLYAPIVEETMHVNRQHVRNKTILYGLFGSVFLLNTCMLGYQVGALQTLNTTTMGLDPMCVAHQLMNTSSIDALGVANDMFVIIMIILTAPCLVFSFFNFLRIYIT